MDAFFHRDDEPFAGSSNSFFWSGDNFPAYIFPNVSSFMPYQPAGTGSDRIQGRNGPTMNINKRVIGFAKRSWPGHAVNRDFGREKGYRHMMSERKRREKHKQSYSALHSLLPHQTKMDKYSIVQAASTRIIDLKRNKEELKRRESALIRAVEKNDSTVGTKIKVRVENPLSGIDSMLEVLRCLDGLGLEMTSIRSEFSSLEFSTIVAIREQIEAAYLEIAIQRKLMEADREVLHKHNPHGI